MIRVEDGEIIYKKDCPNYVLQEDLCIVVRFLKEKIKLDDDAIQLAVAAGLAGINLQDLPKK